MQRLPAPRPLQISHSAIDDAPVTANPQAVSAGPPYTRNATRPTGRIPKPLRKSSSDLHFPVGFGPATTQEQARSPLTTFAGKVNQWASTASTLVDQDITKAVRLINFADRTHAETLDLHGLRLTTLPNCLHEMHSLKKIDLSQNMLSEIPPLPKFLTSLDLRDNEGVKLPAIPEGVRELKVDPLIAAANIGELESLIMKLKVNLEKMPVAS